nr:PH23-94 [Vibrio phage 1]
MLRTIRDPTTSPTTKTGLSILVANLSACLRALRRRYSLPVGYSPSPELVAGDPLDLRRRLNDSRLEKSLAGICSNGFAFPSKLVCFILCLLSFT